MSCRRNRSSVQSAATVTHQPDDLSRRLVGALGRAGHRDRLLSDEQLAVFCRPRAALRSAGDRPPAGTAALPVLALFSVGTPANGIVCERGEQVSLYGRHETCPAFPKRPLSIAPRPLAADRTGGGVLAHAGWDQFDADDIRAVRDQLDNGCKRYVPPAFAALTTGG